jgi:hypothetical protein
MAKAHVNKDIRATEALLNITWDGQNGDLPSPIPFDATEREIRAWAVEAIRSGSIPGIRADRKVNLDHFVVDRFPANKGAPYRRVFLRPETPFG